MVSGLRERVMVALLIMGSAILLFSCKAKQNSADESLDAIKTEESENLTIIMSENGRKSYLFKTPLLEGYTLGRDPYREFRRGISITTYQDDSLTTVNAVLVANYAIYYENRKLWEAKGDVVITKHDGTRLYTQQLFWNSMTKRIYSNVDTKLVTDTDEVVGEGFESDEEMNEPRFRRWKGRMQVDTEQLRHGSDGEENEYKTVKSDTAGASAGASAEQKSKVKTKPNTKSQPKQQTQPEPKARPKAQPKLQPKPQPKPESPSKLQSSSPISSRQSQMGQRNASMLPSGKPIQGAKTLQIGDKKQSSEMEKTGSLKPSSSVE